MSNSYVSKNIGDIDYVVDDKMKVLYELCVVDDKNYDSVRAKLVANI